MQSYGPESKVDEWFRTLDLGLWTLDLEPDYGNRGRPIDLPRLDCRDRKKFSVADPSLLKSVDKFKIPLRERKHGHIGFGSLAQCAQTFGKTEGIGRICR